MAPIRKLEDSTVRLISAGEVIHRPVNAIKELIENSIDAGANKIEIKVLDGGLRSISFLDNGSGINVSDFALVCERHSTSKLKCFEDLSSISTFGFRGEALASISSISRLQLTSKVLDSPSAHGALFLNGTLASGPEPIAWKYEHGTLFEILDLFYSLPTRRNVMLQNSSAEYKKILDLVYYYSLNFIGIVEFTLHNNSSGKDFCSSSEEIVLKSILGSNYQPNFLLNFDDVLFTDKNFGISKAIFSGPQHFLNECYVIIFVNGRLVENKEIRNALKQLYSSVYLSKSKNPFVFLSICIGSEDVDVNYHPSKKEILFKKSDDIAAIICSKLEDKIKSASCILTGNPKNSPLVISPITPVTTMYTSSPHSHSTKTPIRYRTMSDHSAQRIDTFLYREENSLSSVKRKLESDLTATTEKRLQSHAPLELGKIQCDMDNSTPEVRIDSDPYNLCSFISKLPISERSFKEWFSKVIYVGLFEESSCFIQYDLNLLELKFRDVSISYFEHQLASMIYRDRKSLLRLVELDLKTLIKDALRYLTIAESDHELARILGFYCQLSEQNLLILKSLGLSFDRDRMNLITIPDLIDNKLMPSEISLGIMLVRLSSEYEWYLKDETESILFIIREIALCLSFVDHLNLPEKDSYLRHSLFPSIKSYFRESKSIANESSNSFIGLYRKLVDVPTLFRTFERC